MGTFLIPDAEAATAYWKAIADSADGLYLILFNLYQKQLATYKAIEAVEAAYWRRAWQARKGW